VARTFFLSQSQGVFRLLRRYKFEVVDGQEKVTWNDKGYSEDSLFLPLALQKALAQASHDLQEIAANVKLVYYGTTVSADLGDDYEREMDAAPYKLKGDFYPRTKHQHVAPEAAVFADPAEIPDFNNLVDSWCWRSGSYGQVTSYTYHSNNHAIDYLFQIDGRSRAWIGGLELANNTLTTTGLWKSWVLSGDLTTPPWEYYLPQKGIDQTGGFGDQSLRLGSYVDMYANYLSKLAVIRAFEDQLK
jgi:hypothetical protein